MTAANATIHDYGHTIEVDVQDGTYHVNRVLLFTPEEAVAVYAALHAWVSGDKEGTNV